MTELPEPLYSEIERLCAEGDEHVESKEFDSALAAFSQAWHLLPEPKEQWSAGTWILVAIGDTQFLAGDFSESHEAFSFAVMHPGGFGNPFIHLRLGQTALELGETREAGNELIRAYALEGASIFVNEDPKYFDFLKTQAKEPTAGWEW